MNRIVLILAFVLMLYGCRVGPKYYAPNIPVPDQWKMEEEESCQNTTALSSWWEAFEDPVLNLLIERGLTNNPDISEALQHILEERALYYKAKSDLYPSLYLGFGRAEFLEPAGGIFVGQQSLTNFLSTQKIKIKRHFDYYHFGPSINWEIDLFGRIRSAMDAHAAEWESAIENVRGVQLSLTSDIARNYIDLRGYQAELAIENEYQNKLQKRFHSLQKRSLLHLANLNEIDAVKGSISESKISIFQLQRSIEDTKQRLMTLIADFNLPEEIDLPLAIPFPKVDVHAGIPSDLLNQRPDIIQSERALAAATYRIGNKMAEGLPSFVLIGTIGGLAKNIADILKYKSLYWFYDPFLSMPIFDSGHNKSEVATMHAKAEAAFSRYHKTLLVALEEVQTAIYALNFQRMRFNEKNEELQQYENAYQRHTLLYEKSSHPEFGSLASAEDTYYRQKRESVQFEIAVSLNFVTLSKALGGTVRAVSHCETEENVSFDLN